MHYILMST